MFVAAISAVCALLTFGCASGTPTAPAPPGRVADLTPGPGDWTRFGHDDARTATVHGAAIGPGFPAGSTRSVRLDGPVYGQPLVVGDTVFAATENDSVYAVSALDGSVLWRARLAEPFHPRGCGNIAPLGITGTPVYDPDTRRLYAVAEDADAHHVLFALDAATGKTVRRTTVDPPVGDRAFLQQRPALALVQGHVYAAFGGLFGDCGTYTGAVASVDVAGQDTVRWYVASTSGRGGIWAPGGAPLAHGALFYSVGNGDAVAGDPWDGTDSVVALAPAPGPTGITRTDSFFPLRWAADNAADLDLGSMNPAFVSGRILVAGKAGLGYVLPADRLGDAAGRAPAFDHCSGFGAAAVDADIAYVPCAGGIAAVQVHPDGTASVLWRSPSTATGSPTLAGGWLWAADWDHGALVALDPKTGAVAAGTKTDGLPHFASPSASGTRLFLGTLTGLEIFTS